MKRVFDGAASSFFVRSFSSKVLLTIHLLASSSFRYSLSTSAGEIRYTEAITATFFGYQRVFAVRLGILSMASQTPSTSFRRSLAKLKALNNARKRRIKATVCSISTGTPIASNIYQSIVLVVADVEGIVAGAAAAIKGVVEFGPLILYGGFEQ